MQFLPLSMQGIETVHRTFAANPLPLRPDDKGETWRDRALCREVSPEWFYPEDVSASTRPARAVCGTCPVRRECLDDALADDEPFGIRGGLTVTERKAILRAQRAAGQAA